MKKMYQAPQMEAIKLLSENVVMATSYLDPIGGMGSGGTIPV